MADSYFDDKQNPPTEELLYPVLGNTKDIWNALLKHSAERYKTVPQWKMYSKKAGWSLVVSETKKKRALYYLMPKENSFQFSISFGKKAKEIVLGENISQYIKDELESAREYAEGTGISLLIEDKTLLSDLFTLMKIKAAY